MLKTKLENEKTKGETRTKEKIEPFNRSWPQTLDKQKKEVKSVTC